MKDLAASGKTVVWQREGWQTVLFTKDGAFQSWDPESLREFWNELDKPDTWYVNLS